MSPYLVLYIFCLISVHAMELLPQPCVDNEAPAKSFNDTCKYSNECGKLMTCKDNICVCDDGNMLEEPMLSNAKQRCVPGPFFGLPCTTTCQRPYVCAESTESLAPKLCQCPKGSNWNGLNCFVDCKDSEILHEAKCLLKASLKEACKVSSQCISAFSHCDNGLCACLDGFKSNGTVCLTEEEPTCLLGGEPLREKFTQKPGKCERFVVVESCQNCPRLGPSRARVADSPIDVSAAVPPIMGVPKWKSSCPPAHYCQVANQQDFTEGAKGICCPISQRKCPNGTPHKTAVCGTQSSRNACPFETHYCHSLSYNGEFLHSVCCPRACGDREILVGGICYPKKQIKQSCEVDEQCGYHITSRCVKNVCQCAPNYVLNQFGRCVNNCSDEEILINEECFPLKLVNDTCDFNHQCPEGGYCTNDNVCKCHCANEPTADGLCKPIGARENPTSSHRKPTLLPSVEPTKSWKDFGPQSQHIPHPNN